MLLDCLLRTDTDIRLHTDSLIHRRKIVSPPATHTDSRILDMEHSHQKIAGPQLS